MGNLHAKKGCHKIGLWCTEIQLTFLKDIDWRLMT